MYMKGFNAGFYLDFYAPNILERILRGLKGRPNKFFLGMEAGQKQSKKEIEEQEPRLADAYLQDLYGALGSGQAMMKGRMIDVYAVKQRLTAVTEKVLGPDKVHDVLLQVVQQRPM